jgi:hypothetical protein
MSLQTHTRRRFLAGLASAGIGATTLGAEAGRALASASGAPSEPLDRRYGTTRSPRISVSYPSTWFITQELTDVLDPMQLFAIANTSLPTNQRNIHGLANPMLTPADVTLLMLYAYQITPDMAAWSLRSAEAPPTQSIAGLGAASQDGNLPIMTRHWDVYGLQWAVQGFLWIGTTAEAGDIATMDAVLQSISYDEPL